MAHEREPVDQAKDGKEKETERKNEPEDYFPNPVHWNAGFSPPAGLSCSRHRVHYIIPAGDSSGIEGRGKLNCSEPADAAGKPRKSLHFAGELSNILNVCRAEWFRPFSRKVPAAPERGEQ
jgi:hypothetical protein